MVTPMYPIPINPHNGGAVVADRHPDRRAGTGIPPHFSLNACWHHCSHTGCAGQHAGVSGPQLDADSERQQRQASHANLSTHEACAQLPLLISCPQRGGSWDFLANREEEKLGDVTCLRQQQLRGRQRTEAALQAVVGQRAAVNAPSWGHLQLRGLGQIRAAARTGVPRNGVRFSGPRALVQAGSRLHVDRPLRCRHRRLPRYPRRRARRGREESLGAVVSVPISAR